MSFSQPYDGQCLPTEYTHATSLCIHTQRHKGITSARHTLARLLHLQESPISSNSLVWSICCVAHLDMTLEVGVSEEGLWAAWLLTYMLALGAMTKSVLTCDAKHAQTKGSTTVCWHVLYVGRYWLQVLNLYFSTCYWWHISLQVTFPSHRWHVSHAVTGHIQPPTDTQCRQMSIRQRRGNYAGWTDVWYTNSYMCNSALFSYKM